MFDAVMSIVPSLVGGLVGGGLAVWGAVLAVKRGFRELERSEVRRQKVDCIIKLFGLRFVIGIVPVSDEQRESFMFEMNRIAALYCDESEVQRNLRDFFSNRTNDTLIALLRSMSRTTKLTFEGLSNADITNVFLMAPSGWPAAPVSIGGLKIKT